MVYRTSPGSQGSQARMRDCFEKSTLERIDAECAACRARDVDGRGRGSGNLAKTHNGRLMEAPNGICVPVFLNSVAKDMILLNALLMRY